MTLILTGEQTEPQGIEVKTWSVGSPEMDGVVDFGDMKIGLRDFLYAAYYVLTNTSLKENDPRIKFVEEVRDMQVMWAGELRERRLVGPGKSQFRIL